MALVAFSLIYSVLAFSHKTKACKVPSQALKKHKRVGIAQSLVTGLMMVLIFATWTTGLEDLRLLSLCILDQTSMTIVAAVSSLLNGLWGWAATITIVDWWIRKRLSKGGGPLTGEGTE